LKGNSHEKVLKLTVCAMLLALAVIFGLFKIPISESFQPKLNFLPIACAGAMFGPVYGMIIGAMSDILSFIVKPTGAYFPGFTISAAVQGLMYSLVLKNIFTTKSVILPRVILAQILNLLLITGLLNTFWLKLMYYPDTAFITIMLPRITASAFLNMLYVAILYVVIRALRMILPSTLPALVTPNSKKTRASV